MTGQTELVYKLLDSNPCELLDSDKKQISYEILIFNCEFIVDINKYYCYYYI